MKNILFTIQEINELNFLFKMLSPTPSNLVDKFKNINTTPINLNEEECDGIAVCIESYLDDTINKEMQENNEEWDYILNNDVLVNVFKKLDV